jgi:2-oxo-4-hydroxy-4-carboxy--5-ureidoimidazoline (OHCU) decarboxylase
MTKNKVGGYIYQRQLNTAYDSNRKIREALEQINEICDPRVRALVTKAALAVGENQEAIREIERIAANDPNANL